MDRAKDRTDRLFPCQISKIAKILARVIQFLGAAANPGAEPAILILVGINEIVYPGLEWITAVTAAVARLDLDSSLRSTAESFKHRKFYEFLIYFIFAVHYLCLDRLDLGDLAGKNDWRTIGDQADSTRRSFHPDARTCVNR